LTGEPVTTAVARGRRRTFKPGAPNGPVDPAGARRRVASLTLVGVVGVALGAVLGVVATPASPASIRGTENPTVFASQSRGSGVDAEGIARAERIVADVLAAAPECEPDIRLAGAPVEEREEFLREAEQLATVATEVQGLRNVVWRVVERDGHLYGVLYGERCD